MRSPIPLEILERCSTTVRGQKVVADADLAKIYRVSVKVLRAAFKRHRSRFPKDFAIPLKDGYGFTEEGVLMLSAVIKSSRAAEVNVELIRMLCAARPIF